MHLGDWDYVHACHTCTFGMYLLSEQIENTFLTFPVWLHVAVEQTVLHRKFIPRSAASLKSHLSKQGVHSFLAGLRDVLDNRIRGGLEESACCLQETVLVMAVWKEGDGPSRTINREEFKLKGSERRGVHVKNNKRHSGQGDIYTHINCCYLQVQQSFKFPVE